MISASVALSCFLLLSIDDEVVEEFPQTFGLLGACVPSSAADNEGVGRDGGGSIPSSHFGDDDALIKC